MKYNKYVVLICAAAMLASLAACSGLAASDTTTADASDTSAVESVSSTLTGQITAINGNEITLQLGTLEESSQPGTPPDKPEGDAGTPADSSTSPEKPDDSSNALQGQPGDSSGSSNAPGGMPGSSFTAGTETVTLDFTGVELTKNGETVSLEDLAVEDILTVEVRSDNTVVSAEIVDLSAPAAPGGQGNQGGFGGSGQVTQGTSANTLTEDGTYTFSMTGGSLTALNGDMFYVTNTPCVLTLSGVDITNQDTDACLLRVVGNSASHGWGTAGSNGAQVEFTADAQALQGDIVVDTISTLQLTLQNGSTFTGTVNILDNAEGGTAVSDNAVVTVESGCTWTLTDDCTLTSLTNNGTINFNGHTITLADGTVLS